MIDQGKRQEIAERAPDAVLFDSPSFDASIKGTSTGGAVVYDYDSMVEEFASDNACTLEEAAEFIDYNTLRALPYTGREGVPPVIIIAL